MTFIRDFASGLCRVLLEVEGAPSVRRAMFIVPSRGTSALRQESHVLLFPAHTAILHGSPDGGRRVIYDRLYCANNYKHCLLTEGVPSTSMDGIRLQSTSEISDTVQQRQETENQVYALAWASSATLSIFVSTIRLRAVACTVILSPL